MLQDWVFWIDFSKVETCLLLGSTDKTNNIWPSIQNTKADISILEIDSLKNLKGITKVDCIYFHYEPVSPFIDEYIIHVKDTLLDSNGIMIYWEVNRSIVGRFISKVFGLKNDKLNGISSRESRNITQNNDLRKIDELVVYPSAILPKVIAKTNIIFTKFSNWSESSKRNSVLSHLLKIKVLSWLVYFYWPVKLVVLQKNI